MKGMFYLTILTSAAATLSFVAGCSTTSGHSTARSVLSDGGLKETKSLNSRGGLPTRAAAMALAAAPAAPAAACPTPTNEEATALKTDFQSTMTACKQVVSGLERSANNARYTMLGLAGLGTIAGTVVVPTLLARATFAKSTVAGWGGLAGATNMGQHFVSNEGLGPNDFVTTRQAIVVDMRKSIDSYTDPTSDYCGQVRAVAKLASACIAYDIQSASQPINESTVPKGNPSN